MRTVSQTASPLRRLAASPGALRLAACGLLGRIAMGMIPLALILTMTAGAGTYGAAGAVTGAYALGVATGGPLRGRLADRIGIRPVLLATGSSHAVALLAFAAASQFGASQALLCVASLLIGLSLPPTGPAMRAMWDRTLRDEELRRTGQALESVALDIGLLTGPLAVAALAVIAPPAAALVAAAALTVLSALGVAAAPAARERPAAATRDALGALRPAPLRRALAVSVFAIGSLFPVELAVVAFSSEHGGRGSAGLLLGGFSVASLLAGLTWATRRRRQARSVQLAGLLAALAAAFGALVLAPGIVFLAAGLVIAGAAVSPMLIVHFDLIRAAAPPDLAIEAFSWTSALGYGGGAAAAAFAGAAIEHGGAGAGFLVAAAMAATAALLAASVTRAGVRARLSCRRGAA